MDFDRGMSWCLAASIVAAIGIGGAAKGQQIDALFRTTLPTYTTNNTPSTLIVDVNGRLRVAAEGPGGAAFEVQGTADNGAAEVGNPIQVGGVDRSAGGAVVREIAVASDGAVAVVTSGDVLSVGGTAGTALQQGGGAISAGTQRVTQSIDDLVPLATTTDGGAASTRVVTVGGFDGANAQQLLTAASGALRVDPTGTTAQPVTDAAGSLTVDAPVGTPLFARLSDGAAAAGTLANPLFTRPSDGVEAVTITAAGEMNVILTAQPGVDLMDATVNNAAGAGAVNVQDGGNSLTTDSLAEVAPDAAFPGTTMAIAARASTASPASQSADGDATGIWTSRVGAVRVLGGETATVDTAAQTLDQQLVAANTGNRLVWVSYRETAGATAAFVLRHGTLTTDPAIIYVTLNASESDARSIPLGLPCPNGVFLDFGGGTCSVTVWMEDHQP